MLRRLSLSLETDLPPAEHGAVFQIAPHLVPRSRLPGFDDTGIALLGFRIQARARFGLRGLSRNRLQEEIAGDCSRTLGCLGDAGLEFIGRRMAVVLMEDAPVVWPAVQRSTAVLHGERNERVGVAPLHPSIWHTGRCAIDARPARLA